ncbi:MAG: tRNA (guanosine(46)-N7)-methyltransferase TrmB [Chloroflexota bacterium]|nr:tRNA (guanosine(46)-N7)-methyltransferase TrmB [Chloroflexota bacterium]
MPRKLNYLNVSWPLDFASLFPERRPLLVEIGFGNGDYLVNLARTRPDANVIGLEISSQAMDKAERKIAQFGLSNARPIHTRAETALAHLLPPESVNEFHINFPDPWFKKKHSRRRLVKRETAELLASRLVAGGTLLLATDILAYAELAHETFSASPGLSNALEAPWARDLPGRYRSKYEAKAYREGRRAYFFLYKRNTTPLAHPAIIKELDMPHLFLYSPLDAAALVGRFETTRRRHGDIHIALLRAYADPRHDAAVFEAVIEEPTIEQHTMISLSPRAEPGEYIVKMTGVGHARPTAGMHRAVAAVGEWVAAQDEGAQVLERKVRG